MNLRFVYIVVLTVLAMAGVAVLAVRGVAPERSVDQAFLPQAVTARINDVDRVEILAALTNNRVIGLIVGAFVTMVIQSSSATTVMLVSFVQAELMTFGQSLGVILGADGRALQFDHPSFSHF
mgnify:CR=1 FL=1